MGQYLSETKKLDNVYEYMGQRRGPNSKPLPLTTQSKPTVMSVEVVPLPYAFEKDKARLEHPVRDYVISDEQ
jgi:hypothetical protein